MTCSDGGCQSVSEMQLNDKPIFRFFLTAVASPDIYTWWILSSRVLNRCQSYSRTTWEVWKYYDGIKSMRFSQRASRFDPTLNTQHTDAIMESTPIMHHLSHLAQTAQLVTALHLITTHMQECVHTCTSSGIYVMTMVARMTRFSERSSLCPLCPFNVFFIITLLNCGGGGLHQVSNN